MGSEVDFADPLHEKECALTDLERVFEIQVFDWRDCPEDFASFFVSLSDSNL